MKWYFSKKDREEPERNPITEEHFNRNTDRSAAAMLIREGFQNSLDAHHGHSSMPVKIRIYTSMEGGAVAPKFLKDFLSDDLKEHLLAKNSGLPSASTDVLEEDCAFLVFEDFNTTGLTGDIQTSGSNEKSGTDNRFYYFLRAEGVNDKREGKLGSWGVGKTVFPSSSSINTILIASNRADDSTTPSVVMGRCILKYHNLDSDPDTSWRPDVWFGTTEDRHPKFVLPSTTKKSASTLEQFNVLRTDEPGLSVIVPFVDPDEFTTQKLLDGVLEECCFAIATGKLEVDIEDPDDTYTINKANIRDMVKEVKDSVRRHEIEGIVGLAMEFADDPGAGSWITLSDPYPYEPSIGWEGHEWVSDEQLKQLQSTWEQDGILRLLVPVHVREKTGRSDDPREGCFKIMIQRDDDCGNQSPMIVRDGLVIPGSSKRDRPSSINGARAIMWFGEDSIGSLVRLAEDPSHVKLTSNSKKFKGRYVHGSRYLTFIKVVASQVIRLIRGDEDEDRDLMTDLIGLIDPDKQKRKRRRKRPIPPPIPKKPMLQMHQLQSPNGFRYEHGSDRNHDVSSFRVRFAYDCDEKNPFESFEIHDFDVSSDLHVTPIGCRYEIREPNEVSVEVDDPEFSIAVDGFDGRDLVIRPFMIKRMDGDD